MRDAIVINPDTGDPALSVDPMPIRNRDGVADPAEVAVFVHTWRLLTAESGRAWSVVWDDDRTPVVAICAVCRTDHRADAPCPR